MPPRNKGFGWALVLVFLAGANVAATPAEKVELKLALERQEYKLSEPIEVEFQLINQGEKPVWVNRRFKMGSDKAAPDQKEIVLQVKEEGGGPVEMKDFDYESGLPRSDHFQQLKLGEQAVAEKKWNLKDLAKIEKPGEYVLTAAYQNAHGKELGLDVFKQKITSGVKFKVVEG